MFGEEYTLVACADYVLGKTPGNTVSNLSSSRALRDIIGRLTDEGRCILFSSHIMQEVANLGDDLVIIGHGRVLFAGPLAQVSQHANETDLEEAFIKIIEREEGQPEEGE